MNKRTSYEQLISEKAAQCPVPDMADAIWANIEAGLDQLPETADRGSGTESDYNAQVNAANPAGKFTGWSKLSLFAASAVVVTAILMWLNYQQPENHGTNDKQQTPSLPGPVPQKKDSVRFDPVEVKPVIPVFTPAATNKNIVPVLPDTTATKNDTLTNNPVMLINLPALDSVAKTTPVQAPSDSAGTSVEIKRPRGVKGISADDYKIVPVKNDSARKN